MTTNDLIKEATEAWIYSTDPEAALHIGMREWGDRQMAAIRFIPKLIAKIEELQGQVDAKATETAGHSRAADPYVCPICGAIALVARYSDLQQAGAHGQMAPGTDD